MEISGLLKGLYRTGTKVFCPLVFGTALAFNYGCATTKCFKWKPSESGGVERKICDARGAMTGIEHRNDPSYGDYYILFNTYGDHSVTWVRAEDMKDVNENGVLDFEDAMIILDELGVTKENMADYAKGGKDAIYGK